MGQRVELAGGVPRLSLGQELARLRRESRLAQRQLAAHLFVERSYVSHAESGRMLPARRFWEAADRELRAKGALIALFDRVQAADQDSVSAADGEAASLGELNGFADFENDIPSEFEANSRRRTSKILEQMSARDKMTRLAYVEDPNLTRSGEVFLRPDERRVFVLKGPAGCGKTRFVVEFARSLGPDVFPQLHWMNTLDLLRSSLAEEILRYGSIPAGRDPLLTLERVSSGLDHTCLIVIDGLAAQVQVDEVGVHLERILRQLSTPRLRFLIAIRTPPDVELSSFPVLSTSIHEPRSDSPGTSETVVRWTVRKAGEAWSEAVGDSRVDFADLPESLRALATIPLYLRLMIDSGRIESLGAMSAYRLIDHCVRSILRGVGASPARVHRAIMQIAVANLADIFPKQLKRVGIYPDPPAALSAIDLSPLVEPSRSDDYRFTHDALGEYFLATHIAELIIDHGRSHAIVAVLNELAEQAICSATAHHVLEFTLLALDDKAPDLLTMVALAPSVATRTTLSQLLWVAHYGAQFASAAVIRHVATRCVDGDHRDLVRALLLLPGLADGLGEEYPTWLLNVTRAYGSEIWDGVAQHLDQFPEFAGARRLLSVADLGRSDDAVFVASHGAVFGAGGTDPESGPLPDVSAHLDWRVRAALASTLGDTVVGPAAASYGAVLARDPDYKVRAAVAEAVGRFDDPRLRDQVPGLLTDPNWHVRTSLLQGILANPDSEHLSALVTEVITSDASWDTAPFRVRRLTERLSLIAGVHIVEDSERDLLQRRARSAALQVLLREVRSDFFRPSPEIRERLIAQSLASSDPLVLEQARQLADGPEQKLRSTREMFRRMRGCRSLQVALDVHDLDHALTVAAAVEAEVDLIEVGDPLIKAAGMGAVAAVKQAVPEVWVVAEMMCADWGRDQVELAVEAGADAVLLVGAASIASVAAGASAARRLDVPLVLDIPAAALTREWVRDMERAGVDGFTITTNIDLGFGARGPIEAARVVRGWSRLPVAVSGGFGATDRAMTPEADWDILIVGRAICESVHPEHISQQISSLIHDNSRELGMLIHNNH